MKNWLNSVRLSVRNFGSVLSVSVCGLLLALEVVLGLFTVPVSPLLKIGFSFLPVAAAGMLFGPVVGGITGALGDIVSYFLHPTGPYFPGFTLNGFVSGFLYGAFLYGKRISVPRTFAAKACVTLAVGLLLNPLWLSVMYGKAFLAVLSVRAAANLVQLPVDTVLLVALLKILEKGHISSLQQKH